MAITHLVTTSARATAGDAAGSTFTTPTVDTTGANLLVAAVSWFFVTGTSTASPLLTDSKGNTWTLITAASGGNYRGDMYYCLSPIVGSGHTFSMAPSGSGGQIDALVVSAFAGVASYHAFVTKTSSTNVTTSTIDFSATPENGCLLVHGANSGRCVGTPGVSAGWTLPAGGYTGFVTGVACSSFLAHKVQGTAGVDANTLTSDTNVGNATIGAVFQPAVAGALTAGNISITTPATSSTVGLTVTEATGGTGPYTRQWYRSTTSGFTPGGGNIVSGATNLTLSDTGLTAATTYYYKVVHSDSASATVTTSQQAATTAAASSITITTPTDYRVFQRSTGTNLGSIAVVGTYTGSPTAIQASWNGGSFTTIVATPSGGTYSGSLTGLAPGQGTLTVRFSNSTGTTASRSYVGIGDIFVVAGQSNASGRGTNSRSYAHETLKASKFGNNYLWADLTDPVDSNSGQVDAVSSDSTADGSVWPGVATRVMSLTGVPVAFVPCPLSNTSITAWQPGVNHLDRTTLYGSMAYRATQAGCRAILWWQGETDAVNAMSQATYKGHMETFLSAVAADLGVKVVVAQLQSCTAGDAAPNIPTINAAIAELWAGNVNVLPGPALYGMTTNDGYHFTSDDKVIEASRRWGLAILSGVYGIGASGSGGGGSIGIAVEGSVPAEVVGGQVSTLLITRAAGSWTAGTPGLPTFSANRGEVVSQAVLSATNASITFRAPDDSRPVTISASDGTSITVQVRDSATPPPVANGQLVPLGDRESKPICVDFATSLTAGVSVISATVSAVDGAALVSTFCTVVGSRAVARVTGGTASGNVVTVTATLSNGSTVQRTFTLNRAA